MMHICLLSIHMMHYLWSLILTEIHMMHVHLMHVCMMLVRIMHFCMIHEPKYKKVVIFLDCSLKDPPRVYSGTASGKTLFWSLCYWLDSDTLFWKEDERASIPLTNFNLFPGFILNSAAGGRWVSVGSCISCWGSNDPFISIILIPEASTGPALSCLAG